MSTYEQIKGQNILIVSSDPSNPIEGQIWYNSTTNLLKGYQYAAVNAWASGGNYPFNMSSGASAGTQTAGLAFGGADAPGTNYTTTAKYNGTSWTVNPTGLNTARRALAGVGTQDAALAAAGFTTTVSSAVESWNGSTFSPSPSLNTAGYYAMGAGIQTASIVFLRAAPPGQGNGATESWNGSTWTTVNSMSTSRTQGAGFGTQTAAIGCGGANPGSQRTNTESWNGTTWTAVNVLNTGRNDLGGLGIQTAGLAFGGQRSSPPGAGVAQTATELWNGTSWTSNPTGLSSARHEVAGAGTQTAGLATGGNLIPGISNATEEWTGSAVTTRTITNS